MWQLWSGSTVPARLAHADSTPGAGDAGANDAEAAADDDAGVARVLDVFAFELLGAPHPAATAISVTLASTRKLLRATLTHPF
jgi:hypothetical protein